MSRIFSLATLCAIMLVLLLPSLVRANDYGGWFMNHGPVECFFIENLDEFGYDVQIHYSESEAKRLGRATRMAEAGKCYDTSSRIEVLDGVPESPFYVFPPDELSGLISYHIGFFDIGFEYSAAFGMDVPDRIMRRIENDFARCDIRQRIEGHYNIVPITDPGMIEFSASSWQAERARANTWTLKDGSTIEEPTINYMSSVATGIQIADAIGCAEVRNEYVSGKTKELEAKYNFYYLDEEGREPHDPEFTGIVNPTDDDGNIDESIRPGEDDLEVVPAPDEEPVLDGPAYSQKQFPWFWFALGGVILGAVMGFFIPRHKK